MFLAFFKLWFVMLCCVAIPWAAFVIQYWWSYDSWSGGMHPIELLLSTGLKWLLFTLIASSSIILGFWSITYVW